MNNKNNLKISKRYAKSLVGIMLNNDTNKDEIAQNLKNARDILSSSNELYVAMTNPIVSAYDKENIIEAVFERDCGSIVRNFLKLLVEKNRFNLVFLIIDEFIKLINKLNNVALVEVTSAINLEDNRKDEIQNKLKENLNKKIEVKYSVDNSIIAGLVFKIGDDVLDTSFKKKIEDLKKELI